MSIKRLVALLLCAALIALGVYHVYQVEPFLQYLILAPDAAAPQSGNEEQSPADSETVELLRALSTLSESWPGIISHYAVTSSKAQVTMEGQGGSTAVASLTGEYGSPASLPYRLLSSGRNFYDEELQNGASVVILDEQLAIQLFRVGDPIGRTVTLEGVDFTVIGIARHSRGAGEQEAYGAYVPLLTLDQNHVQMNVMTVWAKPVEGAGAFSQFKNDMAVWQQGGTLYNLSKERSRALLPAWLMLVVCLMMAVISAFRAFGQLVIFLARDYQKRLQHCFAVQLTPRLIGCVFLGIAALAATLALFYGWVQLALTMVYTFPEWVPAVPVEISDILSTWWQNVADSSAAIELRSPDVMTLRMLRLLLRLVCLFFTLLFIQSYGVMRGKQLSKKQS